MKETGNTLCVVSKSEQKAKVVTQNVFAVLVTIYESVKGKS